VDLEVINKKSAKMYPNLTLKKLNPLKYLKELNSVCTMDMVIKDKLLNSLETLNVLMTLISKIKHN